MHHGSRRSLNRNCSKHGAERAQNRLFAHAQVDVAAPGAVESVVGQLRCVFAAAAAGVGAPGGLRRQCEGDADVALPLVASEAQVCAHSVPVHAPLQVCPTGTLCPVAGHDYGIVVHTRCSCARPANQKKAACEICLTGLDARHL